MRCFLVKEAQKDERKVHIILSDTGKDLQVDAECIPEEILSATGMDMEELQKLHLQLNKLRSHLLR